MQLKSYRAATIQEAIELIRRDLGPNAAVLHAREAPRRGLARWFGRPLIEVTASPDANVPSRFGANVGFRSAKARSERPFAERKAT